MALVVSIFIFAHNSEQFLKISLWFKYIGEENKLTMSGLFCRRFIQQQNFARTYIFVLFSKW